MIKHKYTYLRIIRGGNGGRENLFQVGGNTCPRLSARVNNDKLGLIEESKALSITLHYDSLQLSTFIAIRPRLELRSETS